MKFSTAIIFLAASLKSSSVSSSTTDGKSAGTTTGSSTNKIREIRQLHRANLHQRQRQRRQQTGGRGRGLLEKERLQQQPHQHHHQNGHRSPLFNVQHGPRGDGFNIQVDHHPHPRQNGHRSPLTNIQHGPRGHDPNTQLDHHSYSQPKNGHGPPLTNVQELQNIEEMEECSPDLGVLSCGGLHEYCMASIESEMGGYCVKKKHRSLQEPEFDEAGDMTGTALTTYLATTAPSQQSSGTYYTSPQFADKWEAEYYYYCDSGSSWRSDCSCSNVDRENGMLTIECGGKDYCFDSWSSCDVQYEQCSYSFNRLEFNGEKNSFSYEACFDQNGFRMCEKFDFDVEPVTYDGWSYFSYTVTECEKKVNGVTCDSCNIIEKTFDCTNWDMLGYDCEPFSYQEVEFDCTNTDWKYTSNDTYDFVPDNYGEYGCDLDCNVCGEGAIMGLPDEFFEIPFWGVIQCGESQSFASYGMLTPNGCSALQLLTADKCGCIVPNNEQGTDESSPTAKNGNLRKLH